MDKSLALTKRIFHHTAKARQYAYILPAPVPPGKEVPAWYQEIPPL